MSYILDALKKSESERLQRDAPGFADLPARSRAAGTPRWIWLLGALLLVNAIVLAGLLLRPAAAPTSESAVEPLPSVRTEPAAPASGREARQAVQAAAEAAPDASDRPTVLAPAAAATGAALTRPDASPAAIERPAPQAAPPEPAAGPAPAAVGGAPTLMQLRADGTLSLPELHLDIHVYSREPAERFVFVNMTKYRERDRLEEGPLIREIGPDGVILEYRDTVFLLPRE